MQPILFIDRDGVILQEPPTDFQIDSFEKTRFVPGAITGLHTVATKLDFYTVLITNQDGLGTASFPEETFWPSQQLMIDTLAAEQFTFNEIHIDKTFPHENKPTRKPGTALVDHLRSQPFLWEQSFVIGDRYTDMELAENLGIKGIFLASTPHNALTPAQQERYQATIALYAKNWEEITQFLKAKQRTVRHERNTHETQISVEINLDGTGVADIQTGLHFFNHMLDQLARHGGIDLKIHTQGDLHIDEHHTIEDTGLALGEAFAKVLADKRGLERYGFALPMDDAAAQVLIDFGGRPWLVWDASFTREKVGDMPTEMFYHFFKSFSDAAKCNLNITCTGNNEHHKIEAIFKAFAKAVKMAIHRNVWSHQLPSTKGVL
ncbi:MAG: bifunctional histidinol-phosphatase/imidazoleglycerol-phosphate dehydratase HisB [Bacteroidetes bacterium]|nr:MAG: bifunctional histidinol-phosphatase/imidazoleglycerol-phosphate dehydratase HisB [Bacteroidota bacterium]TAE71444.1 MAG: bifunctional histidinol-phosphatase/imidazoleglycerol-phosphate dehydratase HisB [Bacteroidota bacterium]TAF93715.1 MAG: bifunctional histidinol-phosphatase/imidazoleglycerol-phosphate dehydratase HisB [Bacteroidota bacterium]